jgi:hypothetical protein
MELCIFNKEFSKLVVMRVYNSDVTHYGASDLHRTNMALPRFNFGWLQHGSDLACLRK